MGNLKYVHCMALRRKTIFFSSEYDSFFPENTNQFMMMMMICAHTCRRFAEAGAAAPAAFHCSLDRRDGSVPVS